MRLQLTRRGERIALFGLLLVPITELGLHQWIVSHVPPIQDFRNAATFVRSQKRDRDLIQIAPSWADPILRWTLGDQISLRDAGPSDFANYERIWIVSIRDKTPAHSKTPPGFSRAFGLVKVRRWDLGKTEVVYDLTTNIRHAEVSIIANGQAHPCAWGAWPPTHGGALGAGPMAPRDRFQCDPSRTWLWVGETVNEDLNLEPRHCVWQHPAGTEPIRVRYRDVPLGKRLVFYADLYYEHERQLENGPVTARIFLDDHEIGEMVHQDGDGRKRIEALTTQRPPAQHHGDITIEVTAEKPHLRSLCWAATLRNDESRTP